MPSVPHRNRQLLGVKGTFAEGFTLCQEGVSWDDAKHAADCHPADGVHPWGETIFAPCVKLT